VQRGGLEAISSDTLSPASGGVSCVFETSIRSATTRAPYFYDGHQLRHPDRSHSGSGLKNTTDGVSV
jgi:hypothetical protein